MGERALTVRDRIIVHLSGFSRFADEFECPEGMCQSGISMATDKSRAHVTLELNRMKIDGLVSERVAHVKGAKSKRKTYNLTAQGTAKSNEINRFLDSLTIKIAGQEDTGAMSGSETVDYLMSNCGDSRVRAVDRILASDGEIDASESEAGTVSEGQQNTAFLEHLFSSPDNVPVTARDAGRTPDANILKANILSRQGHFKEALAVLAEALGNCDSGPDLARLHYSTASIYRKQCVYPFALKEINLSLQLVGDDALMEGRCMMEKAMILYGSGKASESLKLLDSAAEMFKREDSQVDILRCGINKGLSLKELGDIPNARHTLEESLALAEKFGLERFKAYALVNLSDILNEQGEFLRSKVMAEKSSDLFRVLDEPLMMALSLFNLGTAQAGLGDRDGAMTNMDRAISILRQSGLLESRTEWLEKYAIILEEMGEAGKAKSVLEMV